jgi:hypothetical protein
MRAKPILSSERMLHKDYERKGSVEGKKQTNRNVWSWALEAWHQDKSIGEKPQVVK